MQESMDFNTSELYAICKRRDPAALRQFIHDFPEFSLETKLDQHDNRALHCVTARNCIECVDILLRAGASPDSIGGYGNTPLHTAAYLGHLAIAERLLEAGAPVDAENSTGSTPMHLAAEGGHLAVIERLLEAGAHADLPNNLGKTPLHEACSYGHPDVVRRLVAHGVDINRKDTWGGFTPLHLAVLSGHVDIVHILLEAGVDVTVRDGAGKTALELAQRNSNDDIRHALVDALFHETTDPAVTRHTIEDLQWQIKSLKQRLEEIREEAVATVEVGEELVRDLEESSRQSTVVPVRRESASPAAAAAIGRTIGAGADSAGSAGGTGGFRSRSKSFDLTSTISEISAPTNLSANLSELLTSPRSNRLSAQHPVRQHFQKFQGPDDDEMELRGWLVRHMPNAEPSDIQSLLKTLKQEKLGSLRMLRLAKDHIDENRLIELGLDKLGLRLAFLNALQSLQLSARSRSGSVSSLASASTESKLDLFREHLQRLRALSDAE